MGTSTLIHSSHKAWYDQLLKEDNTHPDDRERMALFFVISGNRDLYQKHSFIYNFKFSVAYDPIFFTTPFFEALTKKFII